MTRIRLAFSPCPNDTFVFDAIVNNRIDLEGMHFDYQMHDVETLNHLAMEGGMDVIKVSYHAYLYLQKNFILLDSGSALGAGNGPLLIAKQKYSAAELSGLTVAIPGEYTTAHLLLKLAYPMVKKKVVMVFSEIESAILSGAVDAGVIIHENRFTYESRGLQKIADLGEYWESLMECPIPLGGIIARKGLGYDRINKLNRIMFRSVQYAMKHPYDAMPFVRANAQEMDEDVMASHIKLYVNDYTLSLGTRGRVALTYLMEIARERELIG
jgi:1,4-dihydroxy-6-naphthoate synthase